MQRLLCFCFPEAALDTVDSDIFWSLSQMAMTQVHKFAKMELLRPNLGMGASAWMFSLIINMISELCRIGHFPPNCLRNYAQG